MKLRNKKTGEIGELHFEPDKEYHFTVATEDPADMKIYRTLAALYAEWEDYKNGDYFIDMWEDDCVCDARFGVELDVIERAKECGLHFETEEETERAVEKLKAWTRLENKGFRFVNNSLDICCHTINFKIDNQYDMTDETSKDLFLLFGGEE